MLRVGIVLDSYVSSAWVAKTIQDVQASGFAQIVLVVVDLDHNRQGPRKAGQSFLFQLYERWDYKRNKATDDALESADLSSLLNGIPEIKTAAQCDGQYKIATADEVAAVLDHNLDVLLDLGSLGFSGDILRAARYGLWSFSPGGAANGCAIPPYWAQLFRQGAICGSALLVLTDSPLQRRILYQSFASVDQTSLYLTRNPTYWKTAAFALRSLRELHERGGAFIESLPEDTESVADAQPANLSMVVFAARYLNRWVRARLASLNPSSRTKWCIAIRRRSETHAFDDGEGYQIVPSPSDRFYADPFLIEKDGKLLLFFEDLPFAEGRGVISYCELQPDGSAGPVIEVLRRPYHLSYPYLFEEQGAIYMIPETKGNRTVELYRATSFPTEWALEAVLLDNIYAVDATIYQQDGRYWMFAGTSDGLYSNCDELSIFYADALRGPWKSHPRNPVVSDVRRARPAGKLFHDGSRLIRPSQDCGKAYGFALVFSEILKLDETNYAERSIGRLQPDLSRGQLGNHTYNRTESFEVIDINVAAKFQS